MNSVDQGFIKLVWHNKKRSESMKPSLGRWGMTILGFAEHKVVTGEAPVVKKRCNRVPLDISSYNMCRLSRCAFSVLAGVSVLKMRA